LFGFYTPVTRKLTEKVPHSAQLAVLERL